MVKFKKPVFTSDELDEKKTGITVGYSAHSGGLVGGYDFDKPFKTKTQKTFNKAKEILNGTAKKRSYHEEINSFGWATLDREAPCLTFGIKFVSSSYMGPSKIGKSALRKYKQLLGYNLKQTGWQGVHIDSDDNYVVPLDNINNLKLLYTLSPSIGFYRKSELPDMEFIDQMQFDICSKEKNKNLAGKKAEYIR